MHRKIGLEETLSKQQERACVDWLQARGLEFYLAGNSGLYASAHFEERGEPTIRLYQQRKGTAADALGGVRRVFPEMIFGADLYRSDVNKISFILESYQDFLDAQAAFPDLQAGTWGGQGEIALFGDPGGPAVAKAVAPDRLTEAVPSERENSTGLGDAQ